MNALFQIIEFNPEFQAKAEFCPVLRFCSAEQMTGFYMKHNTRQKCANAWYPQRTSNYSFSSAIVMIDWEFQVNCNMLLCWLFSFYGFFKIGAKLWDGRCVSYFACSILTWNLSWIWSVRAVTMVNIFQDYIWISRTKFIGYISVKELNSGLN